MTRTLTLLPLLALACMEYNGDYNALDSGGAGDDGSWEPPNDGGGDGLGSEGEDDFLALRPPTTDRYVFVVNSARNTVSRISVPGLQVLTTEVGVSPSVALTTPDNARAVIFNEGSDDVTILDAESLEGTTVQVREHFNSMVMSPDGAWVACFRDLDADGSSGSGGGAQSFNEVSLVNTLTGEHHLVVVGYNPRQITFTEDSSTALVVSNEYLAVVDLLSAEPEVRMIQVAEDLLDAPPAEEIALTPTGDYAFLRQLGETRLVIIDLLTELVDRVEVGENPTDLDLTPDGQRAVVVARASSELFVFDATDPYATPEVIALPETELLGSVQFSPDGSKAILYTTAADINHYTTWDLDTDEFTVRALQKPVAGVSLSPDGGTMLVFHEANRDAPETTASSPFYREDALTLIDLDDFRQNTLLLDAPPSAYADSSDGAYGFFIMDGERVLEVIDYARLYHTEIALASDPVHVGVLPATTYAYVNQEHELGRLSFYDPSAGVLETITGFELNSGIEH
ncbi:MAG: hypothetical protein H6740_04045 [Alphaproteobacteria bacterium]|nr:hypothetical protein [Alphaproteobacteria bacterium]